MSQGDLKRRASWLIAQRRAEEKIERSILKHAVKGLVLAFIALMSTGITVSVKAFGGDAPFALVVVLIASLLGVTYSAARGLLLQRRISRMRDM